MRRRGRRGKRERLECWEKKKEKEEGEKGRRERSRQKGGGRGGGRATWRHAPGPVWVYYGEGSWGCPVAGDPGCAPDAPSVDPSSAVWPTLVCFVSHRSCGGKAEPCWV